jgi:hypothetical protein
MRAFSHFTQSLQANSGILPLFLPRNRVETFQRKVKLGAGGGDKGEDKR